MDNTGASASSTNPKKAPAKPAGTTVKTAGTPVKPAAKLADTPPPVQPTQASKRIREKTTPNTAAQQTPSTKTPDAKHLRAEDLHTPKKQLFDSPWVAIYALDKLGFFLNLNDRPCHFKAAPRELFPWSRCRERPWLWEQPRLTSSRYWHVSIRFSTVYKLARHACILFDLRCAGTGLSTWVLRARAGYGHG